MTLALRPDAVTDAQLVDAGVHRDPARPDPIGTGTFAQRLVHKVSTAFGRNRTSRRSFLTRTAVVGSALAVSPFDFILKPGTAYGYVCGTCSDGWTAFCCTINGGRNTCPAGSFVAGWWKADNAAYCCGAARYIIDCNATCPTQCSCRCGGGSCDNRRTCCNQFRYGQCHTEISCYGPVVCRVATCVVPWQYDPSCTTTSRTDNRTVEHGAACLDETCDTAIQRKYRALGGAASPLGARDPGRAGRAAAAAPAGSPATSNGSIYWSSATGAHPLWGRLQTEFDSKGGIGGLLGYPRTDILSTPDDRANYTIFQYGRVYSMIAERQAHTVRNAFHTVHKREGGVRGNLGYPVADERDIRTARGGSVQVFEKGRIYRIGSTISETHGSIYDFTRPPAAWAAPTASRSPTSAAPTPTGGSSSSRAAPCGRSRRRASPARAARRDPSALRGERWRRAPTRPVRPRLPDEGDRPGRRRPRHLRRVPEGPHLRHPQLGAFQIHGGILDSTSTWVAPPATSATRRASSIRRRQAGEVQRFEHGRIVRRADGTIVRA